MKKTLLLVVMAIIATAMTAGNVTPQQALQQARQFVQERMPGHRAGGSVPQMQLADRVSGLYVFNMEGQQGFVIVSNDDRTFPILGYSETGSLNPADMPDNMRAWLQGYADEIAWLNAQNIQVSMAPRSNRAGEVKASIAPLLKTLWNQDAPYSDQTPYWGVNSSYYYVYNTEGGTGWTHCATGCVATAMAMVMKYHQWPTAATKTIPSYTWGKAGITLAELPAVTFDWANMIDNYAAGYTAAQGTAVATLMRYCGQSVQMNYGSQSDAYSNSLPAALKNYFNYNATTQFVSRSFYGYADWIDIIYHELKQGRPVLYGGSSKGGGHEFVCDGYQNEDYFHINWGWGGSSDDYFKLSALNPNVQGIGGSSSTDGYHYGQDAVIGIQKPSDTGTVLDIAGTAPNLTVNSATPATTSCTTTEPAVITLNITNNDATRAYDGDIYLGYNNGSGNILSCGDSFVIPAGGTKDCVLHFTPPSAGTYNLMVFLPNGTGQYQTNLKVVSTVTATAGGGATSATDNVDLGLFLTVDFGELISGSSFNHYGNVYSASVKVTNETDTDYTGSLLYKMLDASFDGSFTYDNITMTVPKNSSVTVNLPTFTLEYGKHYNFALSYRKNGVAADAYWSYYDVKYGIMSFTPDGKLKVEIPTASYTVPDGALAVNLTGTGVTSVTKNSEPNCLFILGSSDAVPAGLTNVITFDGSKYTAADITLKDGHPYFSPVDYTATKIAFDYTFTVGADGSKGWNTIMLPFDVTKVTANGEAIHWFTSSSDEGKQFWLKEFTSDAPSKVNFSYVSGTMQANTPYIVAFPGSKWGTAWDLSGKTIQFVGENVNLYGSSTTAMKTGGNFRFIGSTLQDNTLNIYVINGEGNKFVLQETGGSAPFRAYFKPGTFDRELTSLGIGSDDGTTGIRLMDNGQRTMDNGQWYNLNGQRVSKPTKGLYISNGKKVIVN